MGASDIAAAMVLLRYGLNPISLVRSARYRRQIWIPVKATSPAAIIANSALTEVASTVTQMDRLPRYTSADAAMSTARNCQSIDSPLLVKMTDVKKPHRVRAGHVG